MKSSVSERVLYHMGSIFPFLNLLLSIYLISCGTPVHSNGDLQLPVINLLFFCVPTFEIWVFLATECCACVALFSMRRLA